MPRQPRLDASNTLHHVMVRGLERRASFRDDADRDEFVARLAALAEAGALTRLRLGALAQSRPPPGPHWDPPPGPVLGVRPQNVYRVAAAWGALPGNVLNMAGSRITADSTRQRPHLGDDVDVPRRTDLGGSRIGQEEARGTAAQEDHPVGENARKESGTFLRPSPK